LWSQVITCKKLGVPAEAEIFGHTFGLADWPKLAERAKRFGHFTVARAADWPTNIFGVSAI